MATEVESIRDTDTFHSIEHHQHEEETPVVGGVQKAVSKLKSLYHGIDLTDWKIPPSFSDPRSLLQVLADMHLYCQDLTKLRDKSLNELERMIVVVKFFLSALHCRRGVKKPFISVDHETHKAEYFPLTAGTEETIEKFTVVGHQVSHSPPISVVESSGFGLNFRVQLDATAKFQGRFIRIANDGHMTLSLENGEVYEMRFPELHIRGIWLGLLRIEYAGKIEISCQKTGLFAHFNFHPKPLMFGDWDKVTGEILYQNRTFMATLEGKWNDQVNLSLTHYALEYFGQKCYNINEPRGQKKEDESAEEEQRCLKMEFPLFRAQDLKRCTSVATGLADETDSVNVWKDCVRYFREKDRPAFQDAVAKVLGSSSLAGTSQT